MDLLRELYHVLLAVAFFVSSTLGAKDKELYCGGKFYMPTIMNFRLQLTPGGGGGLPDETDGEARRKL